jgi:hypothetical protein
VELFGGEPVDQADDALTHNGAYVCHVTAHKLPLPTATSAVKTSTKDTGKKKHCTEKNLGRDA